MRLVAPLALAAALSLAVGCGKPPTKADPAAAPADDTTPEASKPGDQAPGDPARAPKPEETPTEAPKTTQPGPQTDLKATLGDQPLEGLYAFAQRDLGRGESYQVTFMDREATCKTLRSVMRKDYASMTAFTVTASRALLPDGSLTWAFAGTSFDGGATFPASLVAMPAFAVEGGKVTGTLPADAGHESSEQGALTVAGSFSAPLCDPIPAMKLRVFGTFEEAVDLPAKDSTAKVTVAGQTYEVKGATAFPTPGGDAWDVRLTATPHGCSMDVRDDLVLSVRVGGEETRLSLGGHWIPSSSIVRPTDGLKVESTRTDETVTLTLSGQQDYAPNDVAYKVAAEGTVTATVCKVE